MSTKSTILTGVTNSDLARLQSLVEMLEQSLEPDDLSFLKDLAGDLPRVKTMLPEPMKRVVKELDDAQTAFEAAWEQMNQTLDAFGELKGELDARNPHLLQKAAEIANTVSQKAAEASLRAQALKALVAQHYGV